MWRYWDISKTLRWTFMIYTKWQKLMPDNQYDGAGDVDGGGNKTATTAQQTTMEVKIAAAPTENPKQKKKHHPTIECEHERAASENRRDFRTEWSMLNRMEEENYLCSPLLFCYRYVIFNLNQLLAWIAYHTCMNCTDQSPFSAWLRSTPCISSQTNNWSHSWPS